MVNLITKIKKNAELQNKEINKLIDREKILKELIDLNSKSILDLNNHIIDILKIKQY